MTRRHIFYRRNPEEDIPRRVLLSEREQVPSVPNRIDKLAHRLKGFQQSFTGLENAVQIKSIERALNNLGVDGCVAGRFLNGHYDKWNVNDLHIDKLPQEDQLRIRASINGKVNALWYLPLFESIEIDMLRSKYTCYWNEFKDTYDAFAQAHSIFPYVEGPHHFDNQTLIGPNAKRLYANWLLLHNLCEPNNPNPVLTYVTQANRALDNQPIEVLQGIILKKTRISQENIERLGSYDLWNSENFLRAMCLDKGPRDHIVDHYGWYRKTPEGYNFGQSANLIQHFVDNIAIVT